MRRAYDYWQNQPGCFPSRNLNKMIHPSHHTGEQRDSLRVQASLPEIQTNTLPIHKSGRKHANWITFVATTTHKAFQTHLTNKVSAVLGTKSKELLLCVAKLAHAQGFPSQKTATTPYSGCYSKLWREEASFTLFSCLVFHHGLAEVTPHATCTHPF